MTLKEFVNLPKAEIRRNQQLMSLFVDFYEKAFSVKVSCTPCSFNSNFYKLVNFAKDNEFSIKPKQTKMANYEIKPGHRNEILFYRDKNGNVIRQYAHQLTEDFVKHYLNTTGKELEERKSKFKVLPKLDPDPNEDLNFDKMKKSELIDYLSDHGIETEGLLKNQLVELAKDIK